MECTVCESSSLEASNLEEGLPCLSCGTCGGSWLQSDAYMSWRKARTSDENKAADSSASIPLSLISGEIAALKFCPRCAHILIKYKVGQDINFTIDRCGHCGGVWFDENEWQILKSHNLHDQVYEIFSHEWQSDVRAEERREAMEKILRDRLGDKTYDEFTRFKNWLDTHEKSNELYALLFGTRDKK